MAGLELKVVVELPVSDWLARAPYSYVRPVTRLVRLMRLPNQMKLQLNLLTSRALCCFFSTFSRSRGRLVKMSSIFARLGSSNAPPQPPSGSNMFARAATSQPQQGSGLPSIPADNIFARLRQEQSAAPQSQPQQTSSVVAASGSQSAPTGGIFARLGQQQNAGASAVPVPSDNIFARLREEKNQQQASTSQPQQPGGTGGTGNLDDLFSMFREKKDRGNPLGVSTPATSQPAQSNTFANTGGVAPAPAAGATGNLFATGALGGQAPAAGGSLFGGGMLGGARPQEVRSEGFSRARNLLKANKPSDYSSNNRCSSSLLHLTQV
jgi:hypothetical protein